jgi:dTMP kinase
MKKGKFIVFEGIDGSGKTSLIQSIKLDLENRNIKVQNFFEPTKYANGIKIREFLSGKISLTNEEQIDLFLLDRKDSLTKNILPTLNSGEMILLDRYFYSMAAYQSNEKISSSEIIQRNISENFILPDLLIYLDIEPKLALERTSKRGNEEVFENLSKLTKVKNEYEKILPENCFRLNAALPNSELRNLCLSKILEFNVLESS